MVLFVGLFLGYVIAHLECRLNGYVDPWRHK